MKATQIASLRDWETLYPQIGVTWRAREYTEDNPVVNSYIERAYAENTTATLYEVMMRARDIMTEDLENRERDKYYARLPKRRETWKPNVWDCEETVVWTIRKSNGNHHRYDLDLTASCHIRRDGAVVPTLKNGLNNDVTDTIMVCAAGTPPALAIKQLIASERRQQRAWLSLAGSAAKCEQYAN